MTQRTGNVKQSRVGALLRDWRTTRNKSQLSLALQANVSARHVSFIETGRAKPSRDMVLMLADALDVPLRERNVLLDAAGFAPAYRESAIDAPQLEPVRRAIDWLLKQQEPHPAVVMDRHWNIVRTNDGAVRLFSRLIDLSAVAQPANVLRLMLDPAAIRPFISNWDEVARALLARVAREAVGGVPDPQLRALLDELHAYPGVPPHARADQERALLPIVPVRFRKDRFAADYFSTVTTLGTPQDVTAQELRIESFFPAEG
jgi:transcriptional regulator with XRE-family HTH domain